MKRTLSIIVLLTFVMCLRAQPFEPVNPNATPEARALLASLYRTVAEGKVISGLHHNEYQMGMPEFVMDLDRIEDASGKVPMINGGDLAWDARQVVTMCPRR